MTEEIMNFDLPANRSSIIKVMGVGGGGSNALNYMYDKGIRDVDFVVCNTDAQALENSPVPVKIQLGESLTEGRGAGNKPEIGKQAAIENLNEINEVLTSSTKMVFIRAGMGGGTGTGAAPIIAKAAKELDILTVAIVTIPFRFEGRQRISQAIEGISELEKYTDSLLVINNEKLREVYGNLKLSEAFSKADDILASAAKGIAEIITVPGYINVDFADVQTVMQNSGVAIMGSGQASGDNRALDAIKNAITSPLLNNNDIKGADNILLNITSGTEEVSMDEIGEITDYVSDEVSSDVNIIWGIGTDENLADGISVTIIATGFKSSSIPELYSFKATTEKLTLTEEERRDKNNEVPEKEPDESVVHWGTVTEDEKDKEEETVFQVKDESEAQENELSFQQRTIEFNVKENYDDSQISKDGLNFKVDTRKAADRMKAIKESHEKLKETNYKLTNKSDDIEEMENIPAYKRKKRNIDEARHSEKEEISRYSLAEDENKQVRLKDDNSYLHDNVD